MNMIEEMNVDSVETAAEQLTLDERTRLQQIFELFQKRFPSLSSKLIRIVASGALLIGGVGGPTLVRAQETSTSGVGQSTEQAGVEIAQAFPRLGTVNGEVNVQTIDSTNSSIVQTLVKDTTFNILGANADGTWYRVSLNDGRVGWIFAELVVVIDSPGLATPPEAPTGANATATAEAPAVLTFQTVNGETITATPIPSGVFDQAPTPPPSDVIQQYSTPDGRRFGLAFGDNNSPKYEFKDGEWKYVESSRQIYETLLPGRNSDILLQRYPELRWDSEYGMYRFADGRYFSPGLGDVEGGDNYRESDLENGPQKKLFEMVTSDYVPGVSGTRFVVMISDHHDFIENMSLNMDQEQIDYVLRYYLSVEPSLRGKILSVTIAPSGRLPDFNGTNPLPPREIYDGIDRIVVWSGMRGYRYAGGITTAGLNWNIRLFISKSSINLQKNEIFFGYDVFEGVAETLVRRMTGTIPNGYSPDTEIITHAFNQENYRGVQFFNVEAK